MNEVDLISSLSNQRVLPIFRSSHEEIKLALKLMSPLNFSTIELTTSTPNWQKLVKELSSDYRLWFRHSKR